MSRGAAVVSDICDTILSGLVGVGVASRRHFAVASDAEKVELCCLVSFAICLLGSFSHGFPLAANLAVAVLGIASVDAKSDTRPVAFVLFCGITAVTDVVAMCLSADGWGGLVIILNLVPKLAAAAHTFRLTQLLGGEPEEYEAAKFAPSGESVRLPADSYQPVDYHSLASEAAERHSMPADPVGESTHYRAI